MSDIQRTVSLGGLIFGADANTTIPASPNVGVPYRNTSLSKLLAASGWPFATVVDSADFNELMYRITTVLDAIEVQGILFWSAATDYVTGSIVRQTDGLTEKFFEALQASGPSSQARSPKDNIGTFWKEASIGGGASGGYTVQFVSANVDELEKGILYFCTAGSIQLTLPTTNLMDGDKMKIATGGVIGLGTPVTIAGAIEAVDGTADTSLIINTPYSSVELIYNSTSGLWKVCSPIARGVYIASSVPVGTVLAYAANLEPNGFFVCDGRAVSRTTYSQLFSVLGTTYGAGDGSTTFNIPDFRAKFLRGYGPQGTEGLSNLGTGDNGGYSGEFGVEQKEQLPNISGRLSFHASNYASGDAFTTSSGGSGPDCNSADSPANQANFNASSASPIYKAGAHNAPANYAVNFIIKY